MPGLLTCKESRNGTVIRDKVPITKVNALIRKDHKALPGVLHPPVYAVEKPDGSKEYWYLQGTNRLRRIGGRTGARDVA